MPDDTSASIEASLMDGVRAGQSEARARLYELCVRVVFGCLKRKRSKLKLGEHDLEDITRNAATRALEKFHQFQRQPPEKTFSRWLQTITEHEIANFFRMRGGVAVIGGSTFLQRSHQAPAAADGSSVEEWQLEQIRQMDIIRAALDHLKATRTRVGQTTWESFERTAIQGQTAEEAATALSITADSVRKNRERIMKLLQDYLKDLLD